MLGQSSYLLPGSAPIILSAGRSLTTGSQFFDNQLTPAGVLKYTGVCENHRDPALQLSLRIIRMHSDAQNVGAAERNAGKAHS